MRENYTAITGNGSIENERKCPLSGLVYFEEEGEKRYAGYYLCSFRVLGYRKNYL